MVNAARSKRSPEARMEKQGASAVNVASPMIGIGVRGSTGGVEVGRIAGMEYPVSG